MKLLAALLLCAATAWPQYSSSLQRIGGGGSYNALSSLESVKQPYSPSVLRTNMRYIQPGTVTERKQVDGKTWLRLKNGKEEVWVADHPEASYAGVGRAMPCVVVVGPASEDIGGESVYYWFSAASWEIAHVRAFELRRPGVPLD